MLFGSIVDCRKLNRRSRSSSHKCMKKAPGWLLDYLLLLLTTVWIGDVSFLMHKRLKTVVFFN